MYMGSDAHLHWNCIFKRRPKDQGKKKMTPFPPPPAYCPHPVAAATVYYVTNIRAALLLGDPMFYSKQAWVGMYFDRGGGLGGGLEIKQRVDDEEKESREAARKSTDAELSGNKLDGFSGKRPGGIL